MVGCCHLAFVKLEGNDPWKNDNNPWQVISEENVSTPVGDFSCWVIKQSYGPTYTLRYHDKEVGILVKEEFWGLKSGEVEITREISLLSYKYGEAER